MKFFLPSTAIVLSLTLCAQAVPAQGNGEQAEVANQKTEQDARLWTNGDDDLKETTPKFKDEGCYLNDISHLTGYPILTPVGYTPEVSNHECYEYCVYQGELHSDQRASFFGLTIWEGGPVAKNDYVVCNCYTAFTTTITGTPPVTGPSAACLLDRGRIIVNNTKPFERFNVDTVELFSITQ
ncbi:unnamed protein product [Umbelopsis vinacea]|jgi:hypothetical protein